MSVPRRAKVFVSYSHLDEKFRSELEVQLTILQNKGYLEWWTDQRLVPGDEWEKVILDTLQSADIILLLISAYFLASPFCWSVELAQAIARHDEGTARVVPIFVRECVSEETPIEKLHGVPPKSKPISTWEGQAQGVGDGCQGDPEGSRGVEKSVNGTLTGLQDGGSGEPRRVPGPLYHRVRD